MKYKITAYILVIISIALTIYGVYDINRYDVAEISPKNYPLYSLLYWIVVPWALAAFYIRHRKPKKEAKELKELILEDINKKKASKAR